LSRLVEDMCFSEYPPEVPSFSRTSLFSQSSGEDRPLRFTSIHERDSFFFFSSLFFFLLLLIELDAFHLFFPKTTSHFSPLSLAFKVSVIDVDRQLIEVRFSFFFC